MVDTRNLTDKERSRYNRAALKAPYSVTQRISHIKQPFGGYIKPSSCEAITLPIKEELAEGETVHPSIMGLAVDYLTRLKMTNDYEDAFHISIAGMNVLKMVATYKTAKEVIKNGNDALYVLSEFNGEITDEIIHAAIVMARFDVCYRNTIFGCDRDSVTNTLKSNKAGESDIDKRNLRIMIDRSLDFFDEYGPVTVDGFTFEGGYTDTIVSGDGDFLTENVLWDFKVSIRKPNSKYTLQLLMYYLMGIKSGKEEFQSIEKLGIFNPRLNTVYLYDLAFIPDEIIKEVELDIIGYDEPFEIFTDEQKLLNQEKLNELAAKAARAKAEKAHIYYERKREYERKRRENMPEEQKEAKRARDRERGRRKRAEQKALKLSLMTPEQREEYLRKQEERKRKALEPKISHLERMKAKYIGMTKMMNCGMEATVIDYRNCDDITIKFSDGLVKTKVRSDRFCEGRVAHK